MSRSLVIKRRDAWIEVADEEAGVSGHCIRSFKGRVYVNLALRANDEILLHHGDLEVYLELDRLSALHAMLGTFIKEAKQLLREGK